MFAPFSFLIMQSKTLLNKTQHLFNLPLLQQNANNFISIRLLPHLASCVLLILTLFYLNGLFFRYAYPEKASIFQIISTFTIYIGSTSLIIINLFYFTLYYFSFGFTEKFKINSLPWPWHENPVRWRKILKKTMVVYLFNQLFIFPFILALMIWAFTPIMDHHQLPDLPTFLFHLLIMVFLEDFSFYWVHRLLHLPCLYKHIHKKHHEHYNTIHISSVFSHWIEFAFGNTLCMLLGMPFLSGYLHIVTLNGFLVFRLLETHEGHSGYDFPWSPFKIFPFSTDSSYHNFHHLKNLGNYGSFFNIWDTIFKTNQPYLNENEKEKSKKCLSLKGNCSY